MKKIPENNSEKGDFMSVQCQSLLSFLTKLLPMMLFLLILSGEVQNFSESGKQAWGQGVFLRGTSAVNEGMAGIATATPLDSLGAIYWNPATLSAFEQSDMSFGSSVILAHSTVESSFLNMKGSTDGDTGSVPAPYMGMVMKDAESPLTYGFGMLAVGGAQSNYPADVSNPILNEQFGLGRTSAKVEIFDMIPAASYQMSDRFSVGFAPTILIGRLIADPLFFGPTDNGKWSRGAGTRYIWGAGFQVGLFYQGPRHFNIGFCYKSPQWCEKCTYQTSFSDGTPHTAAFQMNVPAIYSLGFSYDGWEKTVLGTDVRFFDYGNAKGFSGIGHKSDGSMTGLGWKSVFAVSVGVQRILTERLTVRCGYSFNENPIGDEAAYLNIPSPMTLQHGVHVGLSFMFRPDWFLSVAYAHVFESSSSGPLPQWTAIDPSSYVKSSASADAITFGVNKKF